MESLLTHFTEITIPQICGKVICSIHLITMAQIAAKIKLHTPRQFFMNPT